MQPSADLDERSPEAELHALQVVAEDLDGAQRVLGLRHRADRQLQERGLVLHEHLQSAPSISRTARKEREQEQSNTNHPRHGSLRLRVLHIHRQYFIN